MSNEYRKNHYIPEFYLKNFTDSDNHFFVFDKEAKWNKIILKSPSNICFEQDRNTFFFDEGEVHKGLEMKTYGYFDNLHSETFRLLAKANFDEFPWNMRTIVDLEAFVPLTYWRSPISDKDFIEHLEKTQFIEELRLRMKNSRGEIVEWSENFKQKFISDKNIRKALRPLLAYSSFGKPHKINDRLEWRIIYNKKNKVNITSDNPIIFREEPQSFGDFRSPVIFPATLNKTLIRINEASELNHCHELFLQDILIFHQAKRYVICSDKDYLQEIANEHKVFEKMGTIRMVKKWLFEKYK